MKERFICPNGIEWEWGEITSSKNTLKIHPIKLIKSDYMIFIDEDGVEHKIKFKE